METRDYVKDWTAEQFLYFCAVRDRLRPKFIERGIEAEDLDHQLNVAAIHEMQEHGVI